MTSFTTDRPVDLILQAGQFVPEFRTSAGIMRAHALALAAGGGSVVLEPGATYTITTPLVFEASKVGLRGNWATLDCSGLSAAAVGLTITNTSGSYIIPMVFEGFYVIGDINQGRSFNATGIRLHTVTALSDARVFLRNIFIRYFSVGISIGNQAFLARFEGVDVLQTKFSVLQENVSTTYTLENVTFSMCTFYNSDCFLKSFIGQQFHFYGCSFDFFGGNQTSDDRAFDLRGGTICELVSSHVEFDYGKNAGDTNCPINITGANTKFLMYGGSIVSSSSGQNPAWTHFIQSSDQTQYVSIIDTQVSKLGRLSAVTADDAWMRGADVTSISLAGTSARVKIRAIPEGTGTGDMPAVVCYQANASNPFREGVSDPHAELGWRCAATSTAVFSSVTGTENSVVPRNSNAVQMKIVPGASGGKVLISLPTLELMRIHAWALFVNTGAAGGTVTIRERLSGASKKFDGTTLTDVIDPRASYAGTTVTPTIGSNTWRRVSWKDMTSQAGGSPRKTGDNFYIEFDVTSMTGSLYISCFAMDLM